MWPFRKKQPAVQVVEAEGPDDLVQYMPPAAQMAIAHEIWRKSVELHEVLPTHSTGRPITPFWKHRRAVLEGFKKNGWAFACITTKAKAVSSVPCVLQERNSRGAWETIDGRDPLIDLFENPNPRWTRQHLMERAVMHLEASGNALMTKVRKRGENDRPGQLNTGPVGRLWLLPPDTIKPIPADTEVMTHYEVTKDGAKLRDVPVDDVVHFMHQDPINEFWGFSPTEAAGRNIDTDVASTDWNRFLLKNRAVAEVVFSSKESHSKTQYEEHKRQITDQHQGPKNAGRPWILGGGYDVKQLALTPRDMDYSAGKRMVRDEICAVYGVPPVLVGIYTDATLNQLKEGQQIFWVNTVIPYLRMFYSTVNKSLTPEFYPDGSRRLWFDVTGIQALWPLLDQRLDMGLKMKQIGWTADMINARLDLGMPELGEENELVAGTMASRRSVLSGEDPEL